jgi:hypothetical protein
MWTIPGVQTNVIGDVVNMPISVTDTNGPVTYSAVGLPAGLEINPDTGMISGTIAYAAALPNGGVNETTLTAVDAFGVSTTITFPWIVQAILATANADIGEPLLAHRVACF